MGELPDLRAVLDPGDQHGAKNELIDRLSRRAVAEAVLATGRTEYTTAIDFGCGVGRLSPLLLEFSDRVVGVDPAANMVARARADHDERVCSFYQGLEEVPSELPQPILVVCVYVLCLIPRSAVIELFSRLTRLVGSDAWFVGIDRIARSPEVVQDIENRSIDWYADVLDEAGWTLDGHRHVRRADSVPQRINARLARSKLSPLGRVLVGKLADLEKRRAAVPGWGPYVDVAMWGHAKPPRSITQARSS
jgi:SAM-dependent methyltransferase